MVSSRREPKEGEEEEGEGDEEEEEDMARGKVGARRDDALVMMMGEGVEMGV